jgi:hypothetical protein
VLGFFVFSGCAQRRPAFQNWQFVRQHATHILVPPDITAPDLVERAFRVDIAKSCTRFPLSAGVINIEGRGKHAQLTVRRSGLENKPTGWLRAWASQLEDHGCVAPGGGFKLAERVVESVPLEPNVAFGLLYANDTQSGAVDVDPQTRLRVLSPFWREAGLGLMASGPHTVTGSGYTLTVTGKSTDNLLCYESTIYAVKPKAARGGYGIAPLYTDRNIAGTTERRPTPAVNYFQFPSEAGFYRLYYESWRNDFTALVIAARTPAELDQGTKKLETRGDSVSCQELSGEMCVTIPKDVAVTPLISVTINGTEALVSRGTTIFNAIRVSGESQPNSILSSLSVYKPWNGRLIAITFDHADAGILDLVLRGDEMISWKK